MLRAWGKCTQASAQWRACTQLLLDIVTVHIAGQQPRAHPAAQRQLRPQPPPLALSELAAWVVAIEAKTGHSAAACCAGRAVGVRRIDPKLSSVNDAYWLS